MAFDTNMNKERFHNALALSLDYDRIVKDQLISMIHFLVKREDERDQENQELKELVKELTETHKQNMTNKMRNRLKLFLFLSVLWLISCTPDSDIPSDGKQGTSFESFSLISDLGTEYKSFLIRDSIIHIQVPRKIDLSNLKSSFTFDGKQVLTDDGRDITENSQPSDFSDWLAPHKYTVVSSGSQKQEWTVTLYDLPVLIVDTPEQKSIDSKEVRVDSCRVTLIDEDGVSVDLGTT